MATDRSLKLFREAATKVPAYEEFLKTKNVNAKNIRNISDFQQVPITNKKNYLQAADRSGLLWCNAKDGPQWFCSTSGSTGEPYYFPRSEELAWRGSWFAEEFLKYSSYGAGKSLVILAFGMGVWIGGVITLRSFEIAAERMHANVAFLPTGYNKTEVIKALKKLSPEFHETILVGYPPFVKDVLDEAEDDGVNLGSLNMRLMFAAEAFSETFRQYVCKKAGVGNLLLDTLNIYGAADMGAMAYETPLSIMIRRLALSDPLLYQDIFHQIEKTPTLAQFNPDFIDFEEIEGELLLTSDGDLPLIRYDIGDHGGVLTYDHIEQLLSRYKVNLDEDIDKANIRHTIKKHPFVFVYERSDLSESLHGIIIYPEFIKEGLLRPSVSPYFTERFTMSTKNDVHHNQFLQINLELKKDIRIKDDLKQQVTNIITKELTQRSSEFAEVSKSKLGKKLIQVNLWPYGHPRYFASGTKQQWVEKKKA